MWLLSCPRCFWASPVHHDGGRHGRFEGRVADSDIGVEIGRGPIGHDGGEPEHGRDPCGPVLPDHEPDDHRRARPALDRVGQPVEVARLCLLGPRPEHARPLYSGRALASLGGPDGQMRCHFRLMRPGAGTAGGGQGRPSCRAGRSSLRPSRRPDGLLRRSAGKVAPAGKGVVQVDAGQPARAGIANAIPADCIRAES